MRKTIVFMLMVCLFAMVGFAAETTVLKVKASSANVRASAETAAAVIKQVKVGTLLESTAKSGNWYTITITNDAGKTVTGYIHASVVDVVEGEDAATQAKPAVRKGGQRSEPAHKTYHQAKDESSVHFKALLGLSLSNLTLSDPLNPGTSKNSLLGFGGGIGVEFGTGMFVFDVEMRLAPGGCRIASTTDTTLYADQYGSAIGLALLAKIRFMEETTPYIVFGPYFAYTLSMKIKSSPAAGGQEIDVLAVSPESVNRLNFGLAFGAGMELPMGGVTLDMSASYMLGLSNNYKPTGTETTSIKTADIVLTLAIKI